MDDHGRIAGVLSSSKLMETVCLDEPRLHGYILRHCDEVAPILGTIPDAFGEYTRHGVEHSVRVFELGEMLLGGVTLSPWEAAIFTLACFHHDVGMACPRSDWDELEKTQSFQREAAIIRDFVLPSARLISDDPNLIRTHTITEYLRRHHGARGVEWINENRPSSDPESIIDDIYLWGLVGRVGVGHTLPVNEIVNDDSYCRTSPIGTAKSVDTLLLTALLRLADICHLSRDRALPHVRKSLQFTSGYSERIWDALGEVDGVTCDLPRSVIVVSGEPKTFDGHRLIFEEVGKIKVELENCHRLLSGTGHSLPWKYVDSQQLRPARNASYVFVDDGRFRLEEGKIIHLLMGSRLYSEPLYALRECVQNSLDAISVVRLEQPSYSGTILIHLHSIDGVEVLDVIDNGSGMDREIAVNHLLSAGSRPFTESERRVRDWGSGNDAGFIAQHGIGFLSSFMIADRVEVYSLYRKRDPLCLWIDSPTRNVEFRKVEDEGSFPGWKGLLGDLATPWQTGHGTCVRLYLKKSLDLSPHRLMQFVAENLPRVQPRLAVAYFEDCVTVRENWRAESALVGYASDELPTSMAQLEERLFGNESLAGTFYEGPPRDAALARTPSKSAGITGIVTLHSARERSRLSQDGILIRDGARDVWRLGLGDSHCPFDFDLDITGHLRLELDAERARIINSDANRERCREISLWIEARGIRSLGALEAPLYFPCGGQYYHGGIDLLQGHGEPNLYFHGELKQWYTPRRFQDVVERLGEGAFVSAKLYTSLGHAHNQSVALRDIQAEKVFILALTQNWSDVGMWAVDDAESLEEGSLGFSGSSLHSNNADFRKLLEDLKSLAPLEEILVALEPRQLFLLPLMCFYALHSTVRFSLKFRVLRLQRRSRWRIPSDAELTEVARLLSESDLDP